MSRPWFGTSRRTVRTYLAFRDPSTPICHPHQLQSLEGYHQSVGGSGETTFGRAPKPIFYLLSLAYSPPVHRRRRGRSLMYRKHLELVELRENAMAARARAARARRLAALSHHGSAAAFERQAATLEKRALTIEDQARHLEATLNADPMEEP